MEKRAVVVGKSSDSSGVGDVAIAAVIPFLTRSRRPTTFPAMASLRPEPKRRMRQARSATRESGKNFENSFSGKFDDAVPPIAFANGARPENGPPA